MKPHPNKPVLFTLLATASLGLSTARAEEPAAPIAAPAPPPEAAPATRPPDATAAPAPLLAQAAPSSSSEVSVSAPRPPALQPSPAADTSVSVTVPRPPSAQAESIVDAIIGGKINAALRYRYEYLERDDLALEARASTLRAALGYETKPLYGVSVFGQFEGITSLGPRDWRLPTADATYKQNQGDNANRPLIVEPVGAEINQAYVKYANPFVTAKVGRQEIALNNARFISVVPWRQSNQTFDAASLDVAPLPGVNATYIFINQVNRTIGQGPLDGQLKMSTNVGNVSYKRPGVVNVAVFDVRLDYRDLPQVVSATGAPVLNAAGEPTRVADGSTNTLGTRIEGPFKLDEKWGVIYGLDFARQTDIGGNPLRVAASYYNAELGLAYKAFGLRLQYAVRGGTSNPTTGEALQTPLSHAWDGWAENFARTPKSGLRTVAAHLAGPVPWVTGLALTTAYFEFFADKGTPDGALAAGDHYGREFDAGLEYRFVPVDKNLLVGARFAYYADDKLRPNQVPNAGGNVRANAYVTYAF